MNKYIKAACGLALSLGLAFSIAPNVFAERPNADFIDVSHHNAEGGLPLSFYQTLKAAGQTKGVVVKVSEGSYYVDPAASVNIANAKAAGMIVNAYHFARYNSVTSAKNEAKWFDKKLQLCGFSKTNDGYVVVDIEDTRLTSNKSDLTAYTNAFIQEMLALGYSKVDVYTGSSYYNNRLIPSKIGVNKPWLAAYPSNPQKGNPTAVFSNGTGAWQWTSAYTGMRGYNLDASEDYAGKYTRQVKSSSLAVKTIGNVSLIDYLKADDNESSFSARAKLAEGYGITNYTGTAAQNLAILAKLKAGVKPAAINLTNSKLNTKQPKPAPVASNTVVKKVSVPATYKVQSVDSLSKIASRYGLTVSGIASMNGIKNPNFIRVGQVIKLSGSAKAVVQSKPAATPKPVYHKVVSGDAVSKLAKRYGSTVAQIKSWNKLDSRYTIYAGKTIRVK